MKSDYLDQLGAKENLCRDYMDKADAIYEFNEFQPSKEECLYLQKAAMLHSEMAQMSIGEEQRYHQRKVHELNQRIKNIVRVIDPARYKQLQENAASRAAAVKAENKANAEKLENVNKTGAPGGSSSAGDGQKKDPLDDAVQKWFKEAPKHSFDDVSGMSELKERLKECISDSRLDSLREYLEIKKLHSYFFIGPPGCGKTYIIEAFAHELMDNDYKFMSLVGSDILSRFVGEAEKIITRFFDEAVKNAPCILFIDEVDGVCKNRSQPHLPEYAASITTAFLTGYNKINNSDAPIIFLGATNYPSQVDNAMLDRVEIIRVPFPDTEARMYSFESQLKDMVALEDGFTFEDMAKATEMYNYRDIQRLVSRIKNMMMKDLMAIYGDEDSALEGIRSQEYRLKRAMFEEAQNNCLPTPKDDIIKELDEWEDKFIKTISE